jgi:putative Holliday junction resolvase
MRLLGIDYGDARIGLSVSDGLGLIAVPMKTYNSVSMRKDADYILSVIKEKGITAVVLGLPVNMDGTIGARAQKTEAFGRVIEKISGVPVVYKDERLTTVYAERSLKESGASLKKMKEAVDSVSAQVILQSYLDTMRNLKNEKN